MNHSTGGRAPMTRLGRAVRAAGDTGTGTAEPRHREEHRQTNWLRDVILGGQDGLVNILGIILGVIAGGGSRAVLLAAGFAAAFTESVSMGAVGWTSALSERDYYQAERDREAAEIDATPQAERQEIRDIYAAKGWPAETYLPNSLLADREQVQVDELAFAVRELGPAESHADSYLTLTADGSRPVAFTGDLAFHGTHPYTADGHTAAWLAALNTLTGELAQITTLYPGHGDPAGPGMLADQRRYLLYYREVIARLSAGQPELAERAKAELDIAMQAFLPATPLTWMIGLGADAVAAELAGAVLAAQ